MQWLPSSSTAFRINHIMPQIADLHPQKVIFRQVSALIYKEAISTLFILFPCSVINITV